jgi:lipoprotein-anchoring transpeptidase ErfK/SrfK
MMNARTIALMSAALMLTAAPVPLDSSRASESLVAATTTRQDRVLFRRPERLRLPDGQVRLVRSVIRTNGPLRHGQQRWDEPETGTGPIWIRVDLSRQIISVFRGEHEIGTTVVLYGADSVPTPTGVYPVLAKYRQHRSSIYDADMPFTLRLTNDGIAIHASTVRDGAATHGCIGVPRSFAEKLFDMAEVGTHVAIQS